MSKVISLMILPTGAAEASPQILLEQSGLWRDMSPSLDIRLAAVRVQTVREHMESLLGELSVQMETAAHPSFTVLKAAFKQHYRVIVPAGVHQALQSMLQEEPADEPPVLRLFIHPATEWIPWELLHDGEDFLGLRFQIARLPIISKSLDHSSHEPHPLRKVYSLLGRNVFDDPHAASLEQAWQQTFNGLFSANISEIRFPENLAADQGYPSIDQLIRAGLDGDILHITCHGGLKDRQDQLYWTLDHASPLSFNYNITPTILSDLVLPLAPLVFGNACASSQAISARPGLSPGFGTLFFSQGARAFIGTFAPITQKTAVAFARRFFQCLIPIGDTPDSPSLPGSGKAVGRALLETKRHFAAQGHPDPSFLYYCLYGPAETNFIVPDGG